MMETTSQSDENFIKNLEETLPVGKGVRVLVADARGIVAFEKPAGIMTHPNAAGLAAARNALLVADYSLKNECYSCRTKTGEIQKIFIVNRLDSPTSGIVLGARNEKLALAMRRAFRDGFVRKIYNAVVVGKPEKNAGIWKNFLRRVRGKDGSLRVEECRETTRDALFAETHFSVIRTGTLAGTGKNGGKPLAGTFLRLEPKTGRTHQLRVQCALRKIPILGDKNYGNASVNRQPLCAENSVENAVLGRTLGFRLFLHAAEIELQFDFNGEKCRFSAISPLPESFSKIIGNA